MENEEVELIDYLNVIWKRSGLILGGVVVCMVAAGGVSLLLPKVYETSLDLKMGQLWKRNSEQVIDNPYRVAEIINSTPFLNQVKEKAGLTQTAYEIKKKRIIMAKTIAGGKVSLGKDPVLINIVTKGYAPQEAVQIAETVSDLIIQEHGVRFEELLNEYKRYEKELESHVAVIKKELQQLDKIIKGQRVNPAINAPAVILLQAQLEQKQTQLVGLGRELRDVRISNARSENTRVIFPPVLPEIHVYPKLVLNVAIAGIVGLIFVLLLAFFLEYLENVKRREESQKKSK